MSSEDNNSFSETTLIDIDTQRFYHSQFWIFLLLIIPSLVCSFFALYHFLVNRALRQALNNHIIIVLLFINLFYEFTDIVCYIHYFRTLKAPSRSHTFLLIWGYIDWTFYALQFILFAWVTIERHILIFHEQLLATKKKRFFVHYLPPIILTIYCLLYYVIVFFFLQCQNDFDNLASPSFFPCAYQNNVLYTYETIVQEILPTVTIVMSSIILLLRVSWQKYRMHQQFNWRRNRKMLTQLLFISFLYLVFPFPFMIIILLQLCGVSFGIPPQFLSDYLLCTYYVLLLLPVACIGSLPKLGDKLKKLVRFRRQRRAVAAITWASLRIQDNRQTIE